METTDMIKWVRGNDINLLVYVKEPEIGNDGQPVKDASGNIVFIPVDLDAYDEWHLGITRCGIQATKYEIAASAGDTEGTIVATIPYTLPCGTYALEFTSRKNGQHIRSYELMMFGIVENNGEANVTFGVIAGERSLDIDLEVQYVAQAIARGKNAYEMWKELDGNEDKTLQDYIETVLDLYTITANCITATENAKADMIYEDNYVYRWNAEQGRYVKTNIYVKGEQGVQGEQGIGIAGIEYSDTDENGNYIYDVYTTDDSVYQITSPRGPQGQTGQTGATGATGPAGRDGTNGTNGSDGITPHIGQSNKHWYIGDTDTGVVAEGVNGTNGQDGADGVTPHIDPTSKHWYVGSTDTGILAEGKDGTNGQDGQDGQDGSDGVTPHIDSTSKHWMIGDTDTGVVAEGQDGQDGQNGQPGADGITPHIDSTTKHWMIGDVDTGIVAEGTTPDLSNYVQKSSTTGLLKNDGTIDTTTYQSALTGQTAYTSKGSATKVPQITTNALGQVTGITEVTITQPDITGKEDKMAIDSTAKTASFTASVGNYYTVNIAASGSVTITLTTPTDNTHISNAVFFVTTSTSPALTFSAASGVDIYVSSSYSIEASKIYEINALWNGTNWSIAAVELEAQS